MRSCLKQFMKKSQLLILVFILVISGTGMSCPICGCGGGNVYMGLLPDFKYQFIGLRFHTTQYHTQLISDPSQFSTNYYNTVELWGGVRLGKRIQLLAFVPYYMNK